MLLTYIYYIYGLALLTRWLCHDERVNVNVNDDVRVQVVPTRRRRCRRRRRPRRRGPRGMQRVAATSPHAKGAARREAGSPTRQRSTSAQVVVAISGGDYVSWYENDGRHSWDGEFGRLPIGGEPPDAAQCLQNVVAVDF